MEILKNETWSHTFGAFFVLHYEVIIRRHNAFAAEECTPNFIGLLDGYAYHSLQVEYLWDILNFLL